MTLTLEQAAQAKEKRGDVIGKAAANGHIDIPQGSEVPAHGVRRIYHRININLCKMETGCDCLPRLDHLSQEPPGCWEMACCTVTVTTRASRPIRTTLF